jgi:hypothetical protein
MKAKRLNKRATCGYCQNFKPVTEGAYKGMGLCAVDIGPQGKVPEHPFYLERTDLPCDSYVPTPPLP